jgi:hypothetical protein
MIYIITVVILIIFILFLNKREGLQTMSAEVYNNTQNICNADGISYFNILDISSNSLINDKSLNKYILDQVYPIGSFYVQYPDDGLFFLDKFSPNELFPGTFWKPQWEDEGIFFRTEGSLSNFYRIGGLQDYALKEIKGTMSFHQTNLHNETFHGGGRAGVFGNNNLKESINLKKISTDDGNGEDMGHRDVFRVSTVLPKNSSDKEIRVKNRLMRVWKRIT